MILMVIKTIGEKHPKKLVEFLPKLCDSEIFNPTSMSMRSSIIAGVGGVNKVILICYNYGFAFDLIFLSLLIILSCKREIQYIQTVY